MGIYFLSYHRENYRFDTWNWFLFFIYFHWFRHSKIKELLITNYMCDYNTNNNEILNISLLQIRLFTSSSFFFLFFCQLIWIYVRFKAKSHIMWCECKKRHLPEWSIFVRGMEGYRQTNERQEIETNNIWQFGKCTFVVKL